MSQPAPESYFSDTPLAATYLITRESTVDGNHDIRNLGDAIELIAMHGEQAFDSVPAHRWAQWLAHFVESVDLNAARICLQRALAHDPTSVFAVFANLLDEVPRGPATLSTWYLEALPEPMLDALSQRALTHAEKVDVAVEDLPGLLTIGGRCRPTETCAVALGHLRRAPRAAAARTADPDSPAMPTWRRAVIATATLIVNPAVGNVFEELLARLQAEPRLIIDAERMRSTHRRDNSWNGLEAEQVMQLYLWAREAMPSRKITPGMIVSTDAAEELPGRLLNWLQQRADRPSVKALHCIAVETDNVYLRTKADQLAAALAAEAAAPLSPQAVLAALSDPRRRTVRTPAQLAGVVLSALDAIATDIQRDRGLRGRFWAHQRAGTRWSDWYVPVDETTLAEQLSAELQRRLSDRIALLREVEIQPRLSCTSADIPDMLAIAITTDTSTIKLPIEIKCNYHTKVLASLQCQLADRYLAGPAGSEGIYIVGYFHGERWDPTDARRREQAGARPLNDLRRVLEGEVRIAADRGATVHVRVLDIPLDLAVQSDS